MMDIIINNFTVIAGTVLSICFSSYVAYHFFRKKKQIETGKDLITAFDETIKTVNNYDGHFYLLENTLLREFEGQRKATREFGRHLSIINRYRFNKAWDKYKGIDEDIPYFRQYVMSNDIQELLLSRIHEILKFTK